MISRKPKRGDKVQIIVEGELREGWVRRTSRARGDIRVSSDPDPCEPGVKGGWSVWCRPDEVVVINKD